MRIALGPLLFHWAPDRIEAFYAEVAGYFCKNKQAEHRLGNTRD